jgi:hypothetical protein
MAQVLYKTIEWQRRLTVTESDGVTRTNLTGKTLKLEVRRRTGDPVLITLTTGAGITHLAQSGDTLGQADIVLAAGLQSVLEAETLHVFNVQLDDQVIKTPEHLEVQSL